MNKTMTNKVRAAGALGLSYWADHPHPSCIWAVDGTHYYPCKIDARSRTIYIEPWRANLDGRHVPDQKVLKTREPSSAVFEPVA